jgi:hypothetical protein
LVAQKQHSLVTHENIFPPSDLPGAFPPDLPIFAPSLCKAAGSSSLNGDPFYLLSFPNKACADDGELSPAYPSMPVFSQTGCSVFPYSNTEGQMTTVISLDACAYVLSVFIGDYQTLATP